MTDSNTKTIRYLSLFSGIGGFELGLQNSKHNFECVGFSEIDKYAVSIYERNFPNHINLGDATKIKTEELPDFDLLVGGFPCQAFSIAGKRRGFDDTRGTLFFEIARVLKDKRPRYFLLENVRGLLSHNKGETFQTILEVLSDLRYDVQWEVLNSKDFGVPQRRERVFIKGYSRR
jgi:DNA (cytosine-5)-methyltransferase 1